MKLNDEYYYYYTNTDFIQCIEMADVNKPNMYAIGCLEDCVNGQESLNETAWFSYKELVDFINENIIPDMIDIDKNMINYHTDDFEYINSK